MDDMQQERVCGGCRHFAKHPIDPNNLAQRLGECRHGPPCVTILPGPREMHIIGYPGPMPVDFPACSQWEEIA